MSDTIAKQLAAKTRPIKGRQWNNQAKHRLAEDFARTNNISATARNLSLNRRTVDNRLGGLDDLVSYYKRRGMPPLKATPLILSAFPAWLQSATAGAQLVWHRGICERDVEISGTLSTLRNAINKAQKFGLVTLTINEGACIDGNTYIATRTNQAFKGETVMT